MFSFFTIVIKIKTTHDHLPNLQYGELWVAKEEIVGDGLDHVVLQPEVGKVGQHAQQVAKGVQAEVVVTKLPGNCVMLTRIKIERLLSR